MRKFAIGALMSAALLGSAACAEKITANTQDPAGPKVTMVTISNCSFVKDVDPQLGEVLKKVCVDFGVSLKDGASAQLEALALSGDTDITSQCTFKWRSSRNTVNIAVNQPSKTAIVTTNPFNVSGGGTTVTATCNGVSGSYNIL